MTPPVMRTRSGFSQWRHSRPFWGGLLVTLAGAEILATVKAPLPVILHVGMQGVAGYLVPLVLMMCGLLLIFNPAQRLFYSIVAAALTAASWLTSNVGGFVLGILLGLIGSALAFAWSPDKQSASKRWADTRSADTRPPAGQGLHEPPPDGESLYGPSRDGDLLFGPPVDRESLHEPAPDSESLDGPSPGRQSLEKPPSERP
jgi:hypothetical protein